MTLHEHLSVPVTAETRSALRAFFRRNFRPEITESFTAFALDETQADQIAAHRGKDRYFLFFDSGIPVGFWMLRGWDEGYEVPSFGVFVDYEHQGKGLGREMVREAIRVARQMMSPAVRLTVYRNNTRAVGLYLSEGFTISGDPQAEKLVMLKTLSPASPLDMR